MVRKAEHNEVASYMTLLALSKRLGQNEKIPALLHSNLKEEQSSDEKLARLFDSTAAMRWSGCLLYSCMPSGDPCSGLHSRQWGHRCAARFADTRAAAGPVPQW